MNRNRAVFPDLDETFIRSLCLGSVFSYLTIIFSFLSFGVGYYQYFWARLFKANDVVS